MANKWVYLFTEGDASMRNLLGGKGANLAEMTNIGLPVPQGFTITTEDAHSIMKMDVRSTKRSRPRSMNISARWKRLPERSLVILRIRC